MLLLTFAPIITHFLQKTGWFLWLFWRYQSRRRVYCEREIYDGPHGPTSWLQLDQISKQGYRTGPLHNAQYKHVHVYRLSTMSSHCLYLLLSSVQWSYSISMSFSALGCDLQTSSSPMTMCIGETKKSLTIRAPALLPKNSLTCNLRPFMLMCWLERAIWSSSSYHSSIKCSVASLLWVSSPLHWAKMAADKISDALKKVSHLQLFKASKYVKDCDLPSFLPLTIARSIAVEQLRPFGVTRNEENRFVLQWRLRTSNKLFIWWTLIMTVFLSEMEMYAESGLRKSS